MTSIEQIQISGIRSFDPNPARRQSIVFHKPLTVILGKNGAGKTTIIEALLNACTGQMPPCSGSEKSSFIYDPKTMGETDVKAQIRLLFTGRDGKLFQVIRSFQATRARTKTTFATLDNTLASKDAATGQVVATTYRTSDLDTEVPEKLGVSRAVLEHVIFCHQEDCNWPLSPPKDVKRIFDDIFAATRYVLALDRLRENGKDLRRQQREHEASLLTLREHREQAAQLSADIAAKEESVRALRARAAGSEPELAQYRAAAAALAAAAERAEALAREAALLQGRIEEKRDFVRRAALPPVKQSLEELVAMRRGLAERARRHAEEAAERAARLAELEAAARRANETAEREQSALRAAEEEAAAHSRAVAELRAALAEAPEGPPAALGNCTDEAALRAAAESAQRAHEAAMAQRDADAAAHDAKCAAAENARDATRDTLAATLAELQHAEKELAQQQQQSGTGGEKKADVTREGVDALREEVAALEARAADADAVAQCGEEELAAQVDKQNTRVAALRESLARHARRATSDARVTVLRDVMAERKRELAAQLANVIRPGLARLADTEGAEDEEAEDDSEEDGEGREERALRRAVSRADALFARRTVALRAAEAKRSEQSRRVAPLAETAAARRAASDAASLELARALSAAGDAGGLPGLSLESLGAVDEALAGARGAAAQCAARWRGAAAAAECAGAADAAECPLCARPFATAEEAEAFAHRAAARRGDSLPALEAAAQRAAAECAALERAAAEARAARRAAASLPALDAAAQRAEADCSAAREAAAAAAEALERAGDAARAAQDLSRAVAQAQRVAQELRDARGQLSRVAVPPEASDAPSDPADEAAAYDAACAELCALSARLAAARGGGDGPAVRARLAERRAALSIAESAVARAEETRRRGSAAAAAVPALARRAAELRESAAAEERAVAAARAARDVALRDGQRRVAAADEVRRRVEAALPPLRAHLARRKSVSRDAVAERCGAAQAAAQAARDEALRARQSDEAAQREVEAQQRHAAAMDRHVDVLERARSAAADEARLAEVAAERAALMAGDAATAEVLAALVGREAAERESVLRLTDAVRQRIGELERARAQDEGAMEAVLQDVAAIRAQLAREKYQDIEKRYRSTFLKVQTTEIAVADIDKYYSALDKAVQSYHQEKIAKVNEKLAELWRETYKGSDIDVIELRSEDEATTSTAVRRSYSYRVVMKRGNTEMDMRGRCSAGQKVLASVLIRLALSDAFCCTCGILALDEPTSNLDEDNARSLAEALRKLIYLRRNVKFFQLIVITHDEQFVRALGGQSLDTFYFVHKDREGAFSVIEERTFEQLFVD